MFHAAVIEPELDLNKSRDRRAQIRRHIKMVMEHLEEVLAELKGVAKDLREVVAQIDRLTSDITFDPEDDLTLTCCSEDHGRGSDDLHTEMVSVNHDLLLQSSLLDTVHNPTTAKKQESVLYRRSCGDLPALNGPLKPPDSPKATWLYGSGGRINYYDKTLYHALCCDDDDDDEDYDEDRREMRSSRLSSTDSVFSSSLQFLTPRSVRKTFSGPDAAKRALRSCSTQTVCDKSTQTHFPAKQRPSSDYKN